MANVFDEIKFNQRAKPSSNLPRAAFFLLIFMVNGCIAPLAIIKVPAYKLHVHEH